MGAEPWIYFVSYQDDFQKAMEMLREQEFKAGRYFPLNDPDFAEELGGERPQSIEEAREIADADGTKSILDIDRVGEDADYSVARRLSDDEIEEYFGTTQPTREIVETRDDFMEDIERGQGVCFPIFKDGKKAGICFAGYSFD